MLIYQKHHTDVQDFTLKVRKILKRKQVKYGEEPAICHVSRKVLEAFKIPQVPDESFGMPSMVSSELRDSKDCPFIRYWYFSLVPNTLMHQM